MTDNNKVNPLLEAIRVPGETFKLPSGGIFYKSGELDESVKDGEVHVHPMTTKHELIMKTPDKLFSGKAVHEIFSECIPEVNQPGKLLAKDVDFLMMALRTVTYGDKLELRATHNCEDANEHKYTINVRDIVRASKAVDPTSIAKNFKMKLDNGQTLVLRPPTFDSVIALYQALDNSVLQEGNDEEIATRLIENLVDMIEEVNGVTDKEMILEWLVQLRAGWVNEISDRVQENSNWGVESLVKIKCKDCNTDYEIDVPTNPITFFT
jgi:hypothetical protein